MRFANIGSWQIDIKADVSTLVFALWLRDLEAIEVPSSPLVPGPLDMGALPRPLGEAHHPRLGEEWLTWWISLVKGRQRQLPHDGAEARRWTEFLEWRTAYFRAHGTFSTRRPVGEVRETNTVREVEATLGRKAAPFSLSFTLLPVRDDRIRQVDATHYLVPERVYLSAGWPAWLRDVVVEVA